MLNDIIALNEVFDKAVDTLTSGLKSIDTDHSYIHDGIAFKTYFEIGDMSAITTRYYAIKTAPGKYLHTKNLKLFGMGGTVRVNLRRGTVANPLVLTGAGTVPDHVIGPNNMNDNADNPSGTIITVDPVIDGGQAGEIWVPLQIVGDTQGATVTVDQAQEVRTEEIVMRPDTYYLLELIKVANIPIAVGLQTFWYEEGKGLA